MKPHLQLRKCAYFYRDPSRLPWNYSLPALRPSLGDTQKMTSSFGLELPFFFAGDTQKFGGVQSTGL
jgi:hypothetical protein